MKAFQKFISHQANREREASLFAIRRAITAAVVFVVFSVGCTGEGPIPTDQEHSTLASEGSLPPEETPVISSTDEGQETGFVLETHNPTNLLPEEERILFGSTNHNPDGNRWVHGHGKLPEVDPLDIPLKGIPVWVVGAAMGEASIWVVALEDGRIEAFHVVEREVSEVSMVPESLKPGMPPLLRIQDGISTLVTVEDPAMSAFTHPVLLDSRGAMAYITKEGELALWSEGETEYLAVASLPDSRILVNDTGDILLLNRATDRYGHGVLGDTIEAAAMLLVKMDLAFPEVMEIQIPEPAVIEGIAPIWVDMDNDGEREIVVTISDAQQGAQLVVFNERGHQVATSEPIGRGFRWRHQIAVAPFGLEGELELVSVRTPHIGGVVEFHQLRGDELTLEASLSGYTTHFIGSRNLDMAVAGDFDGDGNVEVLIPDQSLSRLAGLQRTIAGVEEIWSLPLSGTLGTNVAVASLMQNSMGVGAGMREGFLRLWLP